MMKRPFSYKRIICAILMAITTIIQPYAADAKLENGAHWKETRSESGDVFVELSNGMRYTDPATGEWKETEEQFIPYKESFCALKGYYKAIVLDIIGKGGTDVSIETPDGSPLSFKLSSLKYVDTETGKTMVVGTPKPSIGVLVAPNVIFYKDVYEGLNCDVRVTYGRGSFKWEYEIRSLPTPEAFGMTGSSTSLHASSEFLKVPEFKITNLVVPSSNETTNASIEDSVIEFGGMIIRDGTAFSASAKSPTLDAIRVSKRWRNVDDSYFLDEIVPYTRVAQLFAESGDNERGVVIDPVIVVTQSTPFTFLSGTTYWIRPSTSNPAAYGGYILSGAATFQAGAIIKYNRNSYLSLSGPVTFASGGDPVIFTAVDDDSVGEEISLGQLNGVYAANALWSYINVNYFTVTRAEFKYCVEAIRVDSQAVVNINDCRFEECTKGLVDTTAPTTIYANKPIFCNVASQWFGYVSILNPITGCIPLGNTSIVATINNVTANQVLAEEVVVVAGGSGALTGATLFVDGQEIGYDGGVGPYSLPLDTREFLNGTRKMTVAVQDDGGIGTTGSDDTPPDAPTRYGVKELSVIFNNILSNAKLKYHNFKPDLGQIQTIYGTWSTARSWKVDITADGDPTQVFKSFTGNGTTINANWDGNDGNGQPVLGQMINYAYWDLTLPVGNQVRKIIRAPTGIVGTFVIEYQGHHPRNPPPGYSLPPGVTFPTAASIGPYGPLKKVSKIAKDAAKYFNSQGYYGPLYGDDHVYVSDFIGIPFGGNGVFEDGDIGLYIGHGIYSRNVIPGLGTHQAYTPIYNRAANTMEWADQLRMLFGAGGNLKWMAMYTCNFFRDGTYKSNGDYLSQKFSVSGVGLGMSPQLHILQGYATEVLIHPAFSVTWVAGLCGKSADPTSHTIIGAWNRVCRKTQISPPMRPDNGASDNVARSVYWPECHGDILQGYGPSTSPNPNNLQIDLVEEDEFPN